MIKGSIVALVTPFDEEGSVDNSRLRELINWHIDEGTDAILVLGAPPGRLRLSARRNRMRSCGLQWRKAEAGCR